MQCISELLLCNIPNPPAVHYTVSILHFPMRRLLASLTVAGTLLAPQLSLAAFQTPGEFFDTLSHDTRAHTAASEVHVTAKDMSMAAWISGTSQGTELSDTRADMQATIHVQMPDHLVKAKVQMKIADETMYFLIESLDAGNDPALMTAMSSVKLNQWYALSLKSDPSMPSADEIEQSRQQVLQMVDQMLTLQASAANGGTQYTLGLSRQFRRQMAPLLRDLAKQMGKSMGLRVAGTPVVNVSIKADADGNDLLRMMKYYASMTAGKQLSFVMQGTTQPTGNLNVTAPTDAIDLTQQLESAGSNAPSATSSSSSSVCRRGVCATRPSSR